MEGFSKTFETFLKNFKCNCQCKCKSESEKNNLEEKERLRSVVISGLPEFQGKVSERRKADSDLINNLIDDLGVDIEASSTYRMGIKKDDTSRLIKCVFKTSAQQ